MHPGRLSVETRIFLQVTRSAPRCAMGYAKRKSHCFGIDVKEVRLLIDRVRGLGSPEIELLIGTAF